ncbi:hypothetical protein [Streptomyces sp. SCL15-4]|uniref:hypothetical protein n=1 Tax=Streptomyces sp. SCL15-4 TaxID=2967221 RepID=UPI002966809B|nr:hypothetical protein [Streptomyces sp. SCL15-4]
MTGGPYQLAWYGVDMSTGGIVEDLPSLKPSGALTRRMGASTTLQVELSLDGAPAEWESATAPGRSLLVAVDTTTDTPLWAGAVLPRDGGSADTVQLGAATLEAYLDCRYPGTQTLLHTDQASVVSALVTPALTGGPPFVIDAVATGTTMDYLTDDGDDKTILSCLTEIMGLDGGPEWTIDVVWNAGHNGFQFPLRIRKQVGLQDATPEAVFDFPGCVSDYLFSESYEKDKGATRVRARGEGEGSSRLTSAAQDATAQLANGWPVWEYRYTPATGVTDPNQLNAHAIKSVGLMAEGAQVWTMQAIASQAPRLGTDWGLGDTVRLAVETSRRHPKGADVVARCWSWELEPGADRVRPILVQE